MSFYPGKVIITGEHSVVYGHKAVLSALHLGVTCAVQPIIKNVGDGVAGGVSPTIDSYLHHILQLCTRELKVPDLEKILRPQLTSTLPAKSGLGSSAAVAAAVITAVFAYYHRSLDQHALYQLVLEAEQYIHGRSSGADPSIVVYGGSLVFQQGVATPLAGDFLSRQTFALLDSGPATESTGEMVRLVADHPQREQLIAAIAGLSEAIAEQLAQGVYPVALIRENHLLLVQLGVVSDAAVALIEQLWQVGVVAKITGAGGRTSGSGYIVAWHVDQDFLRQQVSKLAVPTIFTQLGYHPEGMHYETT